MDVRPLAPTSRAPRAPTRPRRPTCVPQRSVIRQQTRWTTVLCLLTGQLSSASLAGAAWPLAALSRHALVRCLPETWTPRIPWGEPERSSAFFVLTSRIPSGAQYESGAAFFVLTSRSPQSSRISASRPPLPYLYSFVTYLLYMRSGITLECTYVVFGGPAAA